MNQPFAILHVEGDLGDARLVQRHLRFAGLSTPILHFGDGQTVLDFLFQRGPGMKRDSRAEYVVLLETNLPKIDGIEVLRQIKMNPELSRFHVIMLTTAADSQMMNRCRQIGCSSYVRKPSDQHRFQETIHRLGLYLIDLSALMLNGRGKGMFHRQM